MLRYIDREQGLLAEPEPVKVFARDTNVLRKSVTPGTRPMLSYEKAHPQCRPTKSGTGPDHSQADHWCYLAIQSGRSIEEAAQKLLEVSGKARFRLKTAFRVTRESRRKMPRLLSSVDSGGAGLNARGRVSPRFPENPPRSES